MRGTNGEPSSAAPSTSLGIICPCQCTSSGVSVSLWISTTNPLSFVEPQQRSGKLAVIKGGRDDVVRRQLDQPCADTQRIVCLLRSDFFGRRCEARHHADQRKQSGICETGASVDRHASPSTRVRSSEVERTRDPRSRLFQDLPAPSSSPNNSRTLKPGGGESANARGIAFPLTTGEKSLSAPEERPLSALILLYIRVLGILLPASAAAEFRSAKRSWQRIGSGIRQRAPGCTFRIKISSASASCRRAAAKCIPACQRPGYSCAPSGEGRRTRGSAKARPASCAKMKPCASAGRMPANVSVSARATVTAGLAKEV